MLRVKNKKALKTIGEAAETLDITPHVIRFWESNFSNIVPVKFNERRYYSPENIALLKQIKYLLYTENYSIKDAVSYFKKTKHPLLRIKEKLLKAKDKLFSILSK